MAMGHLADARASYKASSEIITRLAASNPSNNDLQRDLAASYSKLASALKQIGDLEGALNALQRGHDIVRRLTKLSPGNAEWQRDLERFEGELSRSGQ